jgi:hypothetical protein
MKACIGAVTMRSRCQARASVRGGTSRERSNATVRPSPGSNPSPGITATPTPAATSAWTVAFTSERNAKCGSLPAARI